MPVMPTVFLMVAMASILFKNTVESYEYLSVYKYYGVIFQMVIPTLLWISTEISAHRIRHLEEPV